MKNTSDAKLWLWTISGTNGEHAGWAPTAGAAKRAASARLRELGRKGYRWGSGESGFLNWNRMDVERHGRGTATDRKTNESVALVWKEGA